MGAFSAMQYCGLAGFTAYITGFAALQFGLIDGNGKIYCLTNIIGAALVLVSLAEHFNLASALIQVSWIVIGISGLVVKALSRVTANIQVSHASAVRLIGGPGQNWSLKLDHNEFREILCSLYDTVNWEFEAKPAPEMPNYIFRANSKSEKDGKAISGAVTSDVYNQIWLETCSYEDLHRLLVVFARTFPENDEIVLCLEPHRCFTYEPEDSLEASLVQFRNGFDPEISATIYPEASERPASRLEPCELHRIKHRASFPASAT